MNANRPSALEDDLPTLQECATGECFCEYECERVARGYSRGAELDDGTIVEDE